MVVFCRTCKYMYGIKSILRIVGAFAQPESNTGAPTGRKLGLLDDLESFPEHCGEILGCHFEAFGSAYARLYYADDTEVYGLVRPS